MNGVTDQLAGVGAAAASDGDDGAPGSAGRAATAVDDHDGTEASGREATPPSRVSRWDRPPHPRDWRFFVGTIGKILIATGLLLLGFVAYQLWGTGFETARAQDRLESEFEQLLGDLAVEDPVVDAVDAADVTSDGTDTESSPAEPAVGSDDDDRLLDTPASSAPAIGDDAIAPPADDVAVPVAVDLSDEAVAQEPIPQPARGEPLLRLEIPKLGRDDIVVPGVQLNDLKNGPGHYPDTPLPGQLGNAAIAGHRTTYGAPFVDVDQLEAGDEIITTLLNGDRFVYEVTFVEIVAATDYWVVATSNPDIAELTLTSCHPKYTARDRIVVHSVLNPAKSSNVGVPTFYSLEADPDDAPIPGDDPVLTAPTAEADTDIADRDEPATISDGTTAGSGATDEPATGSDDELVTASPPVDAGGGSDTDDAADDAAGAAAGAAESTPTEVAAPARVPDAAPEPIDAFDQGWFDDAEAFPQIALWASLLALTCLLGHQLAKRYRRWSVGIVVGIVPFLVALYFFYQNVNRLLPPGI